MSSIKLPILEKIQASTFKLRLSEQVQPRLYKLQLTEKVRTTIPSVKLSLVEKAQAVSVKMPIQETAWCLEGFVIEESIVDWKNDDIILLENVRTFITTTVELVDKNHIKLKWFGETVPKVQIYQRLFDEEYTTKPIKEVTWSPNECIIPIDVNSYAFKVLGSQNTGESQEIKIGGGQEFDINMYIPLALNEKRYYFDINVTSEYRMEVNL